MANLARCYKRVFPFDVANPTQLDGLTQDSGRIGFGTPPEFTKPWGPPPSSPNLPRGTGWRPVIISLGISQMGERTPCDFLLTFEEQTIPPDEQGSGAIPGLRFREILFEDSANFIYFVGLPVPVSEESGNPFNLRIVTTDRADSTQVIVDWEWARFALDVTIDNLAELGAALRGQG